MILVIDTTEREKIKLELYDKNIEKFFNIETQDQSEDLLITIDDVLKHRSSRQARTITIKDIDKILVNLGPGSFTGVRVGVTTANTLAWSLNIPVFGYKEGELKKTLGEISKSNQKNFSKIVIPYYI